MVLQKRVIAIRDGQGVSSLDEEDVVQASMLVVMRESRPVGAPMQGCIHGLAFHDGAMAQQHVGHLND